MRINVYAEEMTDETEFVTKELDDGRVFYGVRLYLKSPSELHDTEDDDDRSAITFWVPWTKENGNDHKFMIGAMCELFYAATFAQAHEHSGPTHKQQAIERRQVRRAKRRQARNNERSAQGFNLQVEIEQLHDRLDATYGRLDTTRTDRDTLQADNKRLKDELRRAHESDEKASRSYLDELRLRQTLQGRLTKALEALAPNDHDDDAAKPYEDTIKRLDDEWKAAGLPANNAPGRQNGETRR